MCFLKNQLKSVAFGVLGVSLCLIFAVKANGQLLSDLEISTSPRLGIELELTGIGLEEAAKILQSRIGGKIVSKSSPYEIKMANGDVVSVERVKFKIKDSIIGTVAIKPEDNGISEEEIIRNKSKGNQEIEIVTEPLTYRQAEIFSDAAEKLAEHGGVGTTKTSPVSNQVNVEINEGLVPNRVSKELIGLLKNYYSDYAYDRINNHYQIPDMRKKYLGRPGKGFLKKINKEGYNPTTRQFFDDYMYRQAYEVLVSSEGAWTLKLSKVKTEVLDFVEKNEISKSLRAYKWNDIKIASLLMFWHPKDPLTRVLVRSGWMIAIPAIEFRAPNNSFEIVKRIEEILLMLRPLHSNQKFKVPGSIQCKGIL